MSVAIVWRRRTRLRRLRDEQSGVERRCAIEGAAMQHPHVATNGRRKREHPDGGKADLWLAFLQPRFGSYS